MNQYGNRVVRPTDPSRTGYDFVEWSRSATSAGGAYNFNTSVTSDFTLHAQWKGAGLEAIQTAIEVIEALNLKEADYTAASWAAFRTPLMKAS